MALKLICLLVLTCLTLMPQCSVADEETTTPAGEKPVVPEVSTVLQSVTDNSVVPSGSPESGSTIPSADSKTTTTVKATTSGPEKPTVTTTAGEGPKGSSDAPLKPKDTKTKGKQFCLDPCYTLPCIRLNDTIKSDDCHLICTTQAELEQQWDEKADRFYGNVTTTTDYEYQHCSANISIPQSHFPSKGLNDAMIKVGFNQDQKDQHTAVYCKRNDKDACVLDCSDTTKANGTVDTSNCPKITVKFTSSSYQATKDRRSPFNGAPGRHNLGWTIATVFTLLISATFALTNTLQSD